MPITERPSKAQAASETEPMMIRRQPWLVILSPVLPSYGGPLPLPAQLRRRTCFDLRRIIYSKTGPQYPQARNPDMIAGAFETPVGKPEGEARARGVEGPGISHGEGLGVAGFSRSRLIRGVGRPENQSKTAAHSNAARFRQQRRVALGERLTTRIVAGRERGELAIESRRPPKQLPLRGARRDSRSETLHAF
jgi:hypothetical protein